MDKLFDSMEKDLDIEFIQGVPDAEKIKAIYNDKHHIICLDNLQMEVANSKEAEKLFMQLNHHNNLSVIYLNQNLFYQGKCMCTLNLNMADTVLLKNSMNTQQVVLLGRQLGMDNVLKEAHKDATGKSFGYLVLDLSPKSAIGWEPMFFCKGVNMCQNLKRIKIF